MTLVFAIVMLMTYATAQQFGGNRQPGGVGGIQGNRGTGGLGGIQGDRGNSGLGEIQRERITGGFGGNQGGRGGQPFNTQSGLNGNRGGNFGGRPISRLFSRNTKEKHITNSNQ